MLDGRMQKADLQQFSRQTRERQIHPLYISWTCSNTWQRNIQVAKKQIQLHQNKYEVFTFMFSHLSPTINSSLSFGDLTGSEFLLSFHLDGHREQDWRRGRRTETWGSNSMGERRTGDSSSKVCVEDLQALPKTIASLPTLSELAVRYFYYPH